LRTCYIDAHAARACVQTDTAIKDTALINGETQLIAHIGYPTEAFRAPMIYNPWFASRGINAIVVPMGLKPGAFPSALASVFEITNLRGALITMPHKVAAASLVDTLSISARVAGACNAVVRLPDGSLAGDQFDGIGFVRGLQRKGVQLVGARVLIAGCGGVGSPIAAALAAAGIGELHLFDIDEAQCARLMERLHEHYPALKIAIGSTDPDGFDLVCNATPLGMRADDPLPFDVSRLAPTTFVGEVVMKRAITPLLEAAQARGCRIQVGTDMLFEMIPAYLEFFGYPVADPEELRATAELRY
jgi:shikimate dehydrogenase